MRGEICAHSLPLKIGLPANNSAKIQPTDHTSIAEACETAQRKKGGGSAQKSAIFSDKTHVIRKAEHDLRCAVPPRRDVLGHETLLLRLVEPAREPEIADLELAVRVHEQIARLEIAVQHVGRVDVFETAERLVNEGLEMRIREGLARTDLRVKRGGGHDQLVAAAKRQVDGEI